MWESKCEAVLRLEDGATAPCQLPRDHDGDHYVTTVGVDIVLAAEEETTRPRANRSLPANPDRAEKGSNPQTKETSITRVVQLCLMRIDGGWLAGPRYERGNPDIHDWSWSVCDRGVYYVTKDIQQAADFGGAVEARKRLAGAWQDARPVIVERCETYRWVGE